MFSGILESVELQQPVSVLHNLGFTWLQNFISFYHFPPVFLGT